MVQPRREGDDGQGASQRPSSSVPTMLKALLRERHLQNYGMFKRAYQKAARGLGKDLAETYPSVQTFRRWLAGKVKTLPHAEHCAVLEAMLPGWTAAELFRPYVAPGDRAGSTLLQELLRRRCLHDYRAFCRAYDIAATTIDTSLAGTRPAEPQFHRWISGDMIGLPYPDHCNVLEAMFPGYSARQLFGPHQDDSSPLSLPPAAVSNVTQPQPTQPHPSSQTQPSRGADRLAGLAAAVGAELAESLAGPLLLALFSTPAQAVPVESRKQLQEQLRTFLCEWANTMERREHLRLLGWMATTLAASPLHSLNPDEQERLARAIAVPSRVDEQAIDHIETILQDCKRQEDTFGPHAVLYTVIAQRELVDSLLDECPAELRPRLLSVYSNMSTSIGVYFFELDDVASALHYCEQARATAQEARNTDLATHALCTMSFIASWQGQAHTAIDVAAAAQSLATKTDDHLLRACTAVECGMAYAVDGQYQECMTEFDRALASLASPTGQRSPESPVYWLHEGLVASHQSECLIRLGKPAEAAVSAERGLQLYDSSFVGGMARCTLRLGTARLLSGEVDQAAQLIGEGALLATKHRSARLTGEVRAARGRLQPWHSMPAVRELDERLMEWGIGGVEQTARG